MAEPLYFVTLVGMPEGAERESLEQAFRTEMNKLFGDEGRASSALHAHLDSSDVEEDELTWSAAEPLVIARLPALLPAGAYFVCDLNWKALGS